MYNACVSGNLIHEKIPGIIPPSQPCPKRARQESSGEEYSRYIQTAESALKALQALTEGKANTTAPPPQWLESRLQQLQTLITHIRTTRHTTQSAPLCFLAPDCLLYVHTNYLTAWVCIDLLLLSSFSSLFKLVWSVLIGVIVILLNLFEYKALLICFYLALSQTGVTQLYKIVP